jgi:LuxR family maltose regulon positive regulatory protein
MATMPQGTTFGEVLRRLRLAAGLTQERLAERAGVSAKAVIALENDPARTPRLETVTRLADALGLDREGRARLLAAARPVSPVQAAPEPRERSSPAPAGSPTPPLGREAIAKAVTPPGVQPIARAGRTEALTPEGPMTTDRDVFAGALANAEWAAALAITMPLTSEAESVADGARPPSPGSEPIVAHLLATKLFVPRPRSDLVARPRLLARLDAGLDGGRCTLLSAPAGAGKTTLLAVWLAAVARPVAWIALDERDQDVHQLLRYLIAALQTVAPSVGQAAQAWLDASPPPPRPDVVLTDLLNDLAAQPEPCMLVFDDYHQVHAMAIHEAVAFLLDHLPPTVHLVIATREDPPLPLPRLRARGQLTEIRAADLSFTPDEAVRFLGDCMGIRLTDEQVGQLVERTEGWAAGLQLAGLALRDRADPAAFVAAFAGGHRLVADYLMTEVLDLQPAPLRRFLLSTSILDRLCAPLCDALLAPDGERADAASFAMGDSQATLEALERANLFLVPLDDERSWYRYHHLFADTLHARLARETGAETVASLHRRASTWLARQGLLSEAIQHALAAGAFAEAADWVESLMPVMFAQGRAWHAIERWLSELPEDVVRTRPELCMGRAWLRLNQLDYVSSAAWADATERALAADADPARVRRLRGSIAAARSYIFTLGPDAAPDRAQEFAERALADVSPGEMAFVVARIGLAAAVLAQGQPREAVRSFAEAGRAGRVAGQLAVALMAAGQEVSILSILGERRQALARGRVALAWAAEQHQPFPRGIGPLTAAMSDLLREGNELTEALSLATDSLRTLRAYEHVPVLLVVTGLSLTRAHLALGDADAATAALAGVRPLIQDGPFTALRVLIEAAEAQILLAQGDVRAAASWAVSAPEIGWIPDLLKLGVPPYVAGVQTLGGAVARILIAHSRATGDTASLEQAERSLDAAWALAARHDLGRLRLQVLILRAMLLDCRGDRGRALATLGQAVAAAAPEGYIRPFVDEGASMAALLEAARGDVGKRCPQVNDGAAAFFDTLLAAFPGQPPVPVPAANRAGGRGPTPSLIEPLSPRELDVLRLLAAGRSNAQMARELVVEESTVKSHLIHVYGKLGVHSRTQAVARARDLRLLD